MQINGQAEVAQVVEQWTENPCVGSSSLPLGTIFTCENKLLILYDTKACYR
tara:strand:+ start:488 stop:640 length:153 start_codon:yes stop_codon:yes gene_type:complete